VAAVAGAIQHGHALPGQALAAVQQGRLVGLDDQQVVGLLVGDQELGGLRVGLERVGGDHHIGQVEVDQQWLQAGDFAGGAVDPALGQHRAAGVVHTGQQVDLAAVAAGAAQGLAVHGQRPRPPRWLPSAVAVGEPGADGAGESLRVQAGQGPADGGLGGDGEEARGVAAGNECGPDRLGRLGGPLGDRGHRPGAGQDRGGGDGQDGDERMAAATGSSGVGDGG
jgi:hypothetical protein